jgi:hypothetical protein
MRDLNQIIFISREHVGRILGRADTILLEDVYSP